MRLKKVGLAVTVLLAAILLAVTNPGMDEFHDHLKRTMSERIGQTGRADALSSTMNTFATWLASEYGMQTAQRHDYVLFSVFTARVDGQTRRWIGVGKQFVAVP